MATVQPLGSSEMTLYFGDIHNHCDVSYGRGSLATALANARMQLDFASVTVHAVWPDLPSDDPELDYLVAYHREGFATARAKWPAYRQAVEAANEEGRFVTFPSFEWHSLDYGDYCVYFKEGAQATIMDAPDLPALRAAIRAAGGEAFLIPHHIGYRRGMRGINWAAFSAELSPFAEIFSFHGASESSDGPYPYLHSMGPRDAQSTAQYGWSQGHIFGVVGSTDHHTAFPGSHGYGRLGVWAESLTRDAIWAALAQRRTYALTGDRIELAFAVNERFMGAVAPPAIERRIEVDVCGGDAIDCIEVLHNNRVIRRECMLPQPSQAGRFKVHLEVGWGERPEATTWDVNLQIVDGHLRQVEPRFRGYGPTAAPQEEVTAYTSWTRPDDNCVHFKTRTRQNPSLHTAATEGMALEIEGNGATQVVATVNGATYTLTLGELFNGARTFYLGGFVSPAFVFQRAVPQAEYTQRLAFTHHSASRQRDWYHVRVRQRNGQCAWSSPVWIEAA